MTDSTPKRLSPSDPVSPETLVKFNQLEEARYNIGGRLLALEQDRVRLLASAHQVDQQQLRLFEQVLVERGLPPTAEVTIDSNTGELKLTNPPKADEKPAVAVGSSS